MDDNKKIIFFDDDKKNVEQLSSLERQIVELVGKGKTLKLSEPTVINVDESVAKDFIDSVSVKDDGTIALQGSRIDEAGIRASFSLEGRDEYDQSDLDKVLDAVKWDEFERRREALNAVGYPYDFKPREDGSVNIPTVDESLYWGYAAGLISLKDAAEEFCRAGWTNFVDEEYTSAKFSQLNSRFGKLDADLRPLAVSVKEDDTIELQGRRIDHASFDDVWHCAEECGLDYRPVRLKGDIHVNNFDNGSGHVDLDVSYATIFEKQVFVHKSLYDVHDLTASYAAKGTYFLFQLPDDVQKQVLDRLFDYFQAEDSPMVVVEDKKYVPSYALPALVNGDFCGIENPEDEKNIRGFAVKNAGCIYEIQPNSKGFSKTPAFGQPTDCETVFMVRSVTPKALKEEYHARLERIAKIAIYDRIVNPWQRAFTYNQISELNHYYQTVTPNAPAKEVFSRLLHEVSQVQEVSKVPEKWLSDTANELDDFAEGKVRFESLQLKR